MAAAVRSISPAGRPRLGHGCRYGVGLVTALVVGALLSLGLSATPIEAATPVSAAPKSHALVPESNALAPDSEFAAAAVRPEEGEIQRLYRSVLGRAPDDDGFQYWVSARVEGLPLRAVADGFLVGREYARRFGAGTDAEFVDRAYRNVLGRPGDPSGNGYWQDQLASGLARTELVLLFSESVEHQRRTGTAPAALPDYQPTIATVTASDLADSWRPGCPVAPERLRAVTVDHVGFAGKHRRGTMIVAADAAAEVTEIFRRLYAARYPVQSIVPIDSFDGDDDASMAANNTSAFNCRAITGGTGWSRHAYGTAIDINPVQNPYHRGQTVLPPEGEDHLDRDRYHPAMIRPGDVVTSAFAAAGWRWGGEFRTLKDYQHFQR